jgi:hypothetical protein
MSSTFPSAENQAATTASSSNFWAERRVWWRAEAARTGCDWVGINQTQIEVAALLADLRRKGGMSIADSDIDADEYGALSSTFARACREADQDRARREQILPFRQRDRDHLPTSTKQAIDWLLKFADEQRLRNFLEGRSEEELQRIEQYISWKKSQ